MYNDKNRVCPLCGEEISSEICYEIVMCLTAGFKLSSVPEVALSSDSEAKTICDTCPYSDLS